MTSAVRRRSTGRCGMRGMVFVGLGLVLACAWNGAEGAEPVAAPAAAPPRPHVLFLLADDFRPDALSAFGHPIVRTPHLDRLVQRGFAFRHTYCLGSNSPAVCLPSRNMLLSGRAYFRWKGPQASAADPNLPVAFKSAGYETYHHGKRGNVALDIQKEFEHHRYLEDQKERTSGQPGKAVVDAAIEFLKSTRRDRPLCMYLAFEAPHDPRVAAEEYLRLYAREQIPLPKNYLPLHPFNNGEQLIRDELLAPFPRSAAEIRRHLHEYYAVISGLDAHIGRLLQVLEELKLSEHTLIVFSADHGLAVGSHGLMGKQSLYDHSMRAPLVFAGPGIPHGSSPALAYLMDIFPTLCDLTGVPVPAGLDGRSLVPVLRGTQPEVRDSLFLAYRDVQRAVRDERWKLIVYPQINKQQLFDLQSDPDELRDLSADPAQTPRVAALTARLEEWQRRLGDSQPLRSATPQPAEFLPPAQIEPASKPKRKP